VGLLLAEVLDELELAVDDDEGEVDDDEAATNAGAEMELLAAGLPARTPAAPTGVTALLSPSSELNQLEPPSTSTVDTMFQPVDFMVGYEFMKHLTVSLVSSCSRMMSPGDFGPVSQLLRFDMTWETVGPPG
jgi:hypothetical protein